MTVTVRYATPDQTLMIHVEADTAEMARYEMASMGVPLPPAVDAPKPVAETLKAEAKSKKSSSV